ncbi:MAG: DUF3344 domain-containing protein [Halobacteriota archaeon]
MKKKLLYSGIVLVAMIIIFLLSTATASAAEWDMTLEATNHREPVTFGISPTATNGFEAGIDAIPTTPGGPTESWTQMVLLTPSGGTMKTWINKDNMTWTLRVTINRMATSTVSWTSADVQSFLDITIDNTDMRSVNSMELTGNAEGSVTYEMLINATSRVGPAPPTIVSYTIIPPTITPPQTTTIDVEFSEKVDYRIAIEKGTATIYDWTGDAKNPDPRIWDGTYEANDTQVPDGVYTVNVTGTNTTTDLSVTDTSETITVTAVGEPDLIVEAITPNCGYLFANESNNITAKIENNGTAAAGASNARFELSDGYSEVVAVPALAVGVNTTVTISDPTIKTVGDSVTITVTADCNDEVDESNEANNVSTLDTTVMNNGYKGKTYTGGANMTTWKTFELKGNLSYSLGDSYYLGGYSGWSTANYIANWAASDLQVPGTATVREARLYVPYTFDYVDDIPTNVSLTFNGAAKTFEAHYTDRKSFPTDYGKYGMLVYNVTDKFNSTGGNTATLTNSNWDQKTVSIRGMLLVVIYADESEAVRTIYVNEEFDLLYGGASKCTTPEEATAYAPFGGTGIGTIDTATVESAKLITVAPGAGLDEGELIFNGQTWTDVWSFVGASQIGVDEREVKQYLMATENEAAFQSSADYMEASNAFLVVTYKPYGVDLTVNRTAQVVAPDVNATYLLTVKNTGMATDNYTLVVDNPGGATFALNMYQTSDINPGDSVTVLLNVKNAANGTFKVSVTATSAGDTSKVDYINTTTFVGASRTVTLVYNDDNKGYNYIAWTGNVETSASALADMIIADAGAGVMPTETPLAYYNTTDGLWHGFLVGINDPGSIYDFAIPQYGVISIKVSAEGTFQMPLP